MRRLTEGLLVLVAAAVGMAVVEAGYRLYIFARATTFPIYLVSVADVPPSRFAFGATGSVYGPLTPDKDITFRRYAVDGELFQKVTVPINNLGWVSRRDYTRDKPPGEFRIAVIGDSLTASLHNETPWPDLLEDKLNADRPLLAALGARQIRVLNLGVAGASMQLMASPLAIIARRFAADMVVFNFIQDDLGRRHLKVPSLAELPPEPARPPAAPPLRNAPAPHVVIRGIHVPLLCPNLPHTLSNPDCLVAASWYAPPGTAVDSEAIRLVQTDIARERLWHAVILSPRLLALRRVLGKRVIGVAHAAGFSNADEVDVAIGATALRFAAALAPRLLVTLNPLAPDIARREPMPRLDALQAAVRPDGIEIVRMEPFLPTHLGEAVWRSWYNLPNDGHWSDAGARVYATAMAKAVHRRLLGAGAGGADPDGALCESAFRAVETVLHDGRGAPSKVQTRLLADHAARLRPRARSLYRRATSYADCGFLADLFARLGDGDAARGDRDAAARAWAVALELAPARHAVRRALGATLMAIGRYADAEAELDRLIEAGRETADLRFLRGNARYRQQRFSLAIDDYSRGLELAPDNPGLLIQRAAARYELGALDDALRDADATIAAGMDTEYARAVRTRIVEAARRNGAPTTPR